MASEMTIHREPYLGNLHIVEFYDDRTGQVLGYLQTPQEFLAALRRGNGLDIAFVHFVGGGRPTKTYELRRER